MAKKSKTRRQQLAASAPVKATAPRKRAAPKKRAAKATGAARPAKKAAGGKKRAASALAMLLPLAKARKLAGDLYESAGLAIWAEAIESAEEPARAGLIHLQDAICDAADLFKEARATNPKHLHLYLVACFDRDDLPVTPPHFVTAVSEEEALEIWREAFKGAYGRRKPRARLVPALGEAPELHQ